MNLDFRTPTSFYNDIRTARLQRKLGDSGIAALTFLWCYTALYKAEGILSDMNDEDIEFAAKWSGEKGKLVPTLLELRYLSRLEDGTYAVHEWAETNSWAADAENRSDKARLSNMAKNYPELYEELVAQGYTGIDKANYARLTSEYSARGILRSTSGFQRIASESLAPKPTPTPAPAPAPVPAPTPSLKDQNTVPETPAPVPTTLVPSSASSSSQNPKTEASNKVVKSTKAVLTTTKLKDKKQTENPLNQGKNFGEPKPKSLQDSQCEITETATVERVLSQWNLQLGTLGFPKVQKLTERRKSGFVARIRASQERISLAWWIALFDKIAASDFMRESAAQKANWLTLDWVLLNEQNLMKVLEGKYDSERPVIAEIHRKRKAVQHSTPSMEVTESAPTADGIPEEARRRMSEMYKVWHGTNEGNPYEAANVSDGNGEVPVMEAEFSEVESTNVESSTEDNLDAFDGGSEYEEEMSPEEQLMYECYLEEQREWEAACEEGERMMQAARERGDIQ